jgi:hypothetical protein
MHPLGEKISLSLDLSLAEAQYLLNALADYRSGEPATDAEHEYEPPQTYATPAANYFSEPAEHATMTEAQAAHAHPAPAGEPQHGGGPIDSQGVPWSIEIHASSKAQTEDGAWRLRRGVDKDKARAYVEQWRNKPSAAALNVKHAAPPVTAAQTGIPNPFAPPAAPQYPPVNYSEWLGKYTYCYEKGIFNEANVAEMFQVSGVGGIAEYQTNDNARAVSAAYMATLAA